MRVELLNDIDTIKSGDNATRIELAIKDENNQFVDLEPFKKIEVAVGYQRALINTEPPIIDYERNSIAFTISSNLAAGKYTIEVHLINQDDGIIKAPNAGFFVLTIEKSLDEIGNAVTLFSVQQLLDDIAAVKELVKNITGDGIEEAINSSKLAVTNSSLALEQSQEANTNVQGLIDKIDTAAEESALAKELAVTSKKLADKSFEEAQTVRQEFDRLTTGNATAEVINARGGFSSLQVRLDAGEQSVNEKDTAILNLAKTYTNEKLADITSINLEEYATTLEVDEKVQSAKNYTDEKFSRIPALDLTAYSTTIQVDAKDAQVLKSAKEYTDSQLSSGGAGTSDVQLRLKNRKLEFFDGFVWQIVKNDITLIPSD
ncbi:hypothetical protein [Rummeliibacillus sp. TYF-LIM-RU47]|uniref:hypothetical protein n=1 Tax=Rummeliibacillus sp. TYF-LIM-RU47 TaxID=2608406 RepID=UPI001239AA0D|nr:hypothetical protein [Rummeliibacillus sp. TYF-LIM-RU47]